MLFKAAGSGDNNVEPRHLICVTAMLRGCIWSADDEVPLGNYMLRRDVARMAGDLTERDAVERVEATLGVVAAVRTGSAGCA